MALTIYRVTKGGITAQKLSDRQGYYVTAESPEQDVRISGLLQPGATVDVEDAWT